MSDEYIPKYGHEVFKPLVPEDDSETFYNGDYAWDSILKQKVKVLTDIDGGSEYLVLPTGMHWGIMYAIERCHLKPLQYKVDKR